MKLHTAPKSTPIQNCPATPLVRGIFANLLSAQFPIGPAATAICDLQPRNNKHKADKHHQRRRNVAKSVRIQSYRVADRRHE